MRVLMMGNGPFAAPTLRSLFQSRHEIVAVVVRPARPVHGKASRAVNPCRALAEEHGAAVLDPADINAAENLRMLSEFRPDLLVVCDYGQILKRETLAVARLGGINLHASLLPAYRGAAPINWAIYHGEELTGVTVIHMTPQLDAGPAIGQASTPIGPDETAAQLEPRLADLGAELVLHCCDLLAAGSAEPIAQDGGKATKARRLEKSDGLVDWSRSAAEIHNQVRAFEPWPKTFSFLQRASTGGAALRVILDRVRVRDERSAEIGAEVAAKIADGIAAKIAIAPGTLLAIEPAMLIVATGRGLLGIESVQPEGKRVLTAQEFMNGYTPRVGDRFTASPTGASPTGA